MSDLHRPASRWSTSMSATTKSTGLTNQTIPLVNVRKKLFRQSGSSYKNHAKRTAKSKHDIEELFKLYYSTDIKFDTFQKQIVTGKRIPTAREVLLTQNNLANSSTNVFNSKHCVSREQMSMTDSERHETTSTTITPKSSISKRAVQIQIENNSPTPTVRFHRLPLTTTPIAPNPSMSSLSAHPDESSDFTLLKSVTFLEDIANEIHENINVKKNKFNITQSSKSSLLAVPPAPPPPSLLVMNNNDNNNNRKDPNALSQTSYSTMNSVPQKKDHPTGVTGSAVIVRQRSPTKQSWNKQRTKSSTIMTIDSSAPQSPRKNSSPSISSPLSIQTDAPELPVVGSGQRVVSIPSKCSRYVLVTFPEVPLRYNAPSYVERLLLPERFPNLFQNIVQSYDQHLTTTNRIPHYRPTK